MKAEIVSSQGKRIKVKYSPRLIGRLFGRKEKTIEYTHDHDVYTFGGGYCWFEVETGEQYGRFPMLDNYIRSEKFKR